MQTKFNLLVLFTLLLVVQLSAQPRRELVKVLVSPEQSDWTYKTGERAEFSIQVLKNNVPMNGIEISYRIQPEKVEIWEEGTLVLKDGVAKIKTKRFKETGFLRCHA